jgi:hypothetical protein
MLLSFMAPPQPLLPRVIYPLKNPASPPTLPRVIYPLKNPASPPTLPRVISPLKKPASPPTLLTKCGTYSHSPVVLKVVPGFLVPGFSTSSLSPTPGHIQTNELYETILAQPSPDKFSPRNSDHLTFSPLLNQMPPQKPSVKPFSEPTLPDLIKTYKEANDDVKQKISELLTRKALLALYAIKTSKASNPNPKPDETILAEPSPNKLSPINSDYHHPPLPKPLRAFKLGSGNLPPTQNSFLNNTTPRARKTPPQLIRKPQEGAPKATPHSPQNLEKNSSWYTSLSSAYQNFLAFYKVFKEDCVEAFTFNKKSAGTKTENGGAKKPNASMKARFWEALTSMVPRSTSNSKTSETEPLLPKQR